MKEKEKRGKVGQCSMERDKRRREKVEEIERNTQSR